MHSPNSQISIDSTVTVAEPWEHSIERAGLTYIEMDILVPFLLATDPLSGDPCGSQVDYAISLHREGVAPKGGYLGSFSGRTESPYGHRVKIKVPDELPGWSVRLQMSSENPSAQIKVVSLSEIA